jgi:hypothetical protein
MSSKEKLRQYVGLINDYRAYRTLNSRIWDVCLLYVQGRQHLEYDRDIARYVTAPNQPGRFRVSINLILQFYRTILSKLQMTVPNITVLPASPSTEDIVKARMAEDAFKYYYQEDNFDEKAQKMLEWLLTCGTTALHTYYDSGEERVRTDVYSPYDIFVEKGAQSDKQSRFIALRQFVTREELKAAYPDFAEQIDTAPSAQVDTYDTGNTTYAELDDRIEIFEIFGHEGVTGVMMGQICLFEGEWSGPHPVTVVRYTEVPGRYWGVGLIEPMVELQNLYNRARAQIVQNVELMSNPKWLIPKSAGVSADQIKGRPGEKIYYNAAGGTPKMVSAAPVPGYVLDNVIRLQSEMQDVAGIHATSLGRRAVGVTSGKAIEALATQDVSQLQVTQKSIEGSVKHLAERVLTLMKEYYPEKKMMRMMDSYGRVIFKELRRTSLMDDPEVFVEAGSAFIEEAGAKDSRVLNLLRTQLITPEEARAALSHHTGLDFVSKETADMSHAMDILNAIKEGGTVEIFASDNLPIFIQVFTDFMRTDDFYDLEQDQQDYISDILVAMATFGQPAAAYEQGLLNFKVFPRQEMDPTNALDSVAMQSSEAAQSQTAGDAQELAITSEEIGVARAPQQIAGEPGVEFETAQQIIAGQGQGQGRQQ